jgi:hypothetical protein
MEAPTKSSSSTETCCPGDSLDTFLSFFCDKKAVELVTAIQTSVKLFNYCIPAREAILPFFGDLFMDYSAYYWMSKNKSHPSLPKLNNTTGEEKSKIEYVGELEEPIRHIISTFRALLVKYGLTKQGTNEGSNRQQSPPPEWQRERFKNLITSWASDILIDLNTKHSETSVLIAADLTRCNTKMFLAKQIDLWIDNPVNKLLLDITLSSYRDCCQFFKRLATTNQSCDWLFALTLLEMSKHNNSGKNFTTCMEYIINRSNDIDSLTYILAYMSYNNPKAMKNFPKTNVPLLNLDIMSQLIVDKLCAVTLDIDSIAQLIKLCCSSLERVDHARIRIATKHKLCMSLATSFFLLLEMNGDRFPEILSYTRVSLTCMSLLRQSKVASHILCRALLERSLVYGHLFNVNFDPDLIGIYSVSSDRTEDDNIKLSKENLKVTLGHRFRRLPNHHSERGSKNRLKTSKVENDDASRDPNIPDRQSINSYLLIEAFKSSINNIDAFAELFVEFHCPVMFEKNLWPSDESLRVINEKNLSILRRFEQVPPFWDLYELIGQEKCLKNCLVLVKALLAAHLAMWASATAKSCPDKMNSTTRLIPPLAESGLIPRAFGLTIEVLPNLSPNEVFVVLSDIWNFLKDSVHLSGHEEVALQDDVMAKMYLTKLRIFMCHHMPGLTYVKIFKDLYRPAPKTIPI